jgi:immune inhibitor A
MNSKTNIKHLFLLAVLVFVFSAGAYASSLHPRIEARLKAEGRWDDYVESMNEAYERGVNRPPDLPLTQHHKISLGSGPDTARLIILLVEFSDNLASDDVYGDSAYFKNLISSEGLLENGSMKEFYKENSYGQFVVEGDVYGWMMMPFTYDYYVNGSRGFGGPYPNNAQRLVEDAVMMADYYVDYSKYYDPDGNGVIDGLVVVHAGAGFETTGDSNMIHSHKWNTSSPVETNDGVYCYTYNMNPEEEASPQGSNTLVKIGVFCHEFGHTLGLPDLYDTDYSSSGIGKWSLMAGGSYNGQSEIPAQFDAWCKYRLGWVTPDLITENEIGHEFPPFATSGHVARIWTDGDDDGHQYYLIYNNNRVGFNKATPGEGLMILHVDQSQFHNRTEYKYLVAVEQADGDFDLEENRNGGDSGDPYPGASGAREFSEMTVPSSLSNTNDTTYVSVWGISDSDSIMTANLDINYTRPRLELLDYYVEESEGNGNGYIEPGEKAGVFLSLINYRADAESLYVYTSVDNDQLVVEDSAFLLGDLASGAQIDNLADPILIDIPETADPSITEINIRVLDKTETDSVNINEIINIGGKAATVLLVDQDDNNPNNFETMYMDVLDSLRIPYELYSRDNDGTPSSEYLNYGYIFWFVSSGSIDSNDVDFLSDYMDAGGRLFLCGQNIAESLSASADSNFLPDYLKCNFDFTSDETNLHIYRYLFGVDGSTTGSDSIKLFLNVPGSVDILTDVDPEALPAFSYRYQDEDKGVAGVEYQGDYGLVFWGFGLEHINDSFGDYNSKYEAVDKIIAFLNQIATDAGDYYGDTDNDQIPRDFNLGQNYPNPFNPTTTIAYDLDRDFEQVSLKIYNILGQEVKTLVNGPQDAGRYEVRWDGTAQDGSRTATGVYFYRLDTGDNYQSRKMLLMK